MGQRTQLDGRGIIQWVVGIICSGLLAWMLYISGGPERSYDLVAIVGMIVLIAILLGYQESLVKVIRIWRGGSDERMQSLADRLEELDSQREQRERNEESQRQTQQRHAHEQTRKWRRREDQNQEGEDGDDDEQR